MRKYYFLIALVFSFFVVGCSEPTGNLEVEMGDLVTEEAATVEAPHETMGQLVAFCATWNEPLVVPTNKIWYLRKGGTEVALHEGEAVYACQNVSNSPDSDKFMRAN